jgi:hypothetical protein
MSRRMRDDRGMATTTEVPNPTHEVVAGMTWEVRPTLQASEEFSEDRVARLDDRLRSRGVRCWLGRANGDTGEGVTGTILVDAITPGTAADRGTRLLAETAKDEGIETSDVLEVVVAPAERDEE